MVELKKLVGALAIFSDAAGAWPRGTRVVKINSEAEDKHVDGALATVLGSMGPVLWEGQQTFGYCIQWDDMPGGPVWIKSTRLEQVKQ